MLNTIAKRTEPVSPFQTGPKRLITVIEMPIVNPLDALLRNVCRLSRTQVHSHVPNILVCVRKEIFYNTAEIFLKQGLEAVLLTRGVEESPPVIPGIDFEEHDFEVKSKVLPQSGVIGDCQVFLVPIEECYFENLFKYEVKFDVCIVFQADCLTETEAIVPIAYYSVGHLLLMGNNRKVDSVSDLTKKYGFDKSLYERMFNSSKLIKIKTEKSNCTIKISKDNILDNYHD